MECNTAFVPVTEKTIRVNGINIAMKCWGDENDPPLLALHGWLDNAASFDLIAPLVNGYYIVAPDIAGHGLSGHRGATASYYLWEHAIDMTELITAMGWSRFSIMAHSMGTGIATILASLNNNIEKMLFIDGMGAPFTIDNGGAPSHLQRAYRLRKMAERVKMDGFSDAHEAMFNSTDEAIKNRMKGVGGMISYDASKILVARGLKALDSGYRWRHDPRLTLPDFMLLSHDQAMEFLSGIDVPLCLLLGDQGLFVGGIFTKKRQALPYDSEVFWLEGGHHFHLETSAENAANLINEFLFKHQRDREAA